MGNRNCCIPGRLLEVRPESVQGNQWRRRRNLGAIFCNRNWRQWLTLSGTLSTTATGSAVFNGAFSALGNTEIGASSANTLRADATSQFYSPVTINTSTSLTTAGALIATGAATFEGAFNINNNATIGSDGTDVLTVHSATMFEGPATTNGTMICAAGLGRC